MSQIQLGGPIHPIQTITAAKYFWRVNLSGHLLSSVQVRWFDGTIDAGTSWKLYFSDMEEPTVPATAGTPDLSIWDEDTNVVFVGPVGSAKGCEVVPLGNNGSKWMLIEATFTAVGEIEIWLHGKD